MGMHAFARAAGAIMAGLVCLGPVRSTPPAREASGRVLRVCADPNDMPFSNRKGEGFENRIAVRIARQLGVPLAYAWLPQTRGFVRKSLDAGRCDIIMGVPRDYDLVRTTRPYFRSTYAFVYRANSPYTIHSLDDTVLAHLRIGIHVIGDDYENTPPAEALAARGIIDNVTGFPIFGDYAHPNPAATIIHAVAHDSIDVAIVWGPFAGYFAPRESARLTVTPLERAVDVSGQPFAYDISLGVRNADTTFALTLDSLLVQDQAPITQLLRTYGVPLLPLAIHESDSAQRVTRVSPVRAPSPQR